MNDDRAEERYRRLCETVRVLAQHIDWLAPFMSAKANESGDVAGMQLNAKDAASEARKLLHSYEVEDVVRAKELAEGGR